MLLRYLGLGNIARTSRRAGYIASYGFPEELRRRLAARRPRLTLAQVDLTLLALRQYFLACLLAREDSIAKHVGMPSKAADDAWHEFIVVTRDYASFCRDAFGEYLHHTPHALLSEPIEDSLANTLHQLHKPAPVAGGWRRIGSVPLLFALDRELGIPDGYIYDAAALESLEAHRRRRSTDNAAIAGDSGGAYGDSDCNAASVSCDAGGGDGGGGGGCGGGGCGS